MSPQTTDAIAVRILYDSHPGHPTAAVPRAFAVASHLALAAILLTLFFRWERERLHVVFGCDPAGYLRLTQLISDRGFLGTAGSEPEVPSILAAVKQRPPEAQIDNPGSFLVPLSFFADEQGRVHSQYPPGFPLILSLLYRQGGEPAVYYAQPIFLLAGILLSYLLLWRFFHPLTALPGTAVVAASNWYFAESTLLMADHAAACLALASLLFGLLALRSTAVWSWVWAAGCGATAGFGVLVRYQSALLTLPLLVLAFAAWRRHGLRWLLSRGVVTAALVALTGAVPLALYQHSLSGSYLQPTYGDADLSLRNISARHVAEGLQFYAGVFDRRLGFWIVPLALGILGMAVVRQTRLLLAVWLAAFLAVAGFHVCVGRTYERYLLMLVPLFAWPAGMALGLFFDALGFWSRQARVAMALAILLPTGYFAARVEHLDCGISNPVPQADYRILADLVPHNAVVLCYFESGAVPIYAHRRTARLWGYPAAMTKAAIDYWADRGTPVYCLLDSPQSRMHFEELQRNFGRLFEPVEASFRKWQLYRLVGVEPEGKPRAE